MSDLQNSKDTKAFKSLLKGVVKVETTDTLEFKKDFESAREDADRFIKLNKSLNLLEEEQIIYKAHNKNEHEILLVNVTKEQEQRANQINALIDNGLAGELTVERIKEINGILDSQRHNTVFNKFIKTAVANVSPEITTVENMFSAKDEKQAEQVKEELIKLAAKFKIELKEEQVSVIAPTAKQREVNENGIPPFKIAVIDVADKVLHRAKSIDQRELRDIDDKKLKNLNNFLDKADQKYALEKPTLDEARESASKYYARAENNNTIGKY